MPLGRIVFTQQKKSESGKVYSRIGIRPDGQEEAIWGSFFGVLSAEKGDDVEYEFEAERNVFSKIQKPSSPTDPVTSSLTEHNKEAGRGQGSTALPLQLASYAKDLVVAGYSPLDAAAAIENMHAKLQEQGDERATSMLVSYCKDLVVGGMDVEKAIGAIQSIWNALGPACDPFADE